MIHVIWTIFVMLFILLPKETRKDLKERPKRFIPVFIFTIVLTNIGIWYLVK